MEKLDEKKIQGYAAEAAVLEETVTDLIVSDKPSYESMLILVDLSKEFQVAIISFFAKMKAATNEAHKVVCTQERESLAPFRSVETNAETKAGKWHLEEQLRVNVARRIEQKRLDDIAREAQIKEVERLRKYKQPKAAQAIEEKPPEVQKAKVESAVEGSGFTMVDNWKARVKTLSKVPRKYLIADIGKLTTMAKDQKGENAPIGVEFYNEPYPVKRR